MYLYNDIVNFAIDVMQLYNIVFLTHIENTTAKVVSVIYVKVN